MHDIFKNLSIQPLYNESKQRSVFKHELNNLSHILRALFQKTLLFTLILVQFSNIALDLQP